MQLTPENTRQGYENLWAKMTVRPEKKPTLEACAKRIEAGRPQYEDVERATGVPWWLIGILHLRESNLDFKTFLGNGEPLDRVTRLVPKGLGPWSSWKDGAIEALKHEGLDKVKTWDIPTALYHFEAFNGFGYVSKNINSPYVWSGTNLYSRGKFVADGKFSALFIDSQPGCAAMLQTMILMGLIPELLKKVISMADPTTPAPAPAPVAPVPSANTSTGVTINSAQNLATHILTAVGAIFAAMGLSQIHGIYDAITNSSIIGGLIVSALAMVISHFSVAGSNNNTIDILDRLVVALTPVHPSPFVTQAASQPTTPVPTA